MSTNAPYAPLPVKVMLDQERTITYDRLAEYHMGTLPRPSRPQDLLVPQKSGSALIQWIWACLSPRDRREFPTPESLVPVITEEKVADLVVKFHETWDAVQPKVKEGEVDPNANGSKNGPSPASS